MHVAVMSWWAALQPASLLLWIVELCLGKHPAEAAVTVTSSFVLGMELEQHKGPIDLENLHNETKSWKTLFL